MKYLSLSREEAREKILVRVVLYLSAAVVMAMIGWAYYFWHLFQLYRGR